MARSYLTQHVTWYKKENRKCNDTNKQEGKGGIDCRADLWIVIRGTDNGGRARNAYLNLIHHQFFFSRLLQSPNSGFWILYLSPKINIILSIHTCFYRFYSLRFVYSYLNSLFMCELRYFSRSILFNCASIFFFFWFHWVLCCCCF